VYEQPVVEKGSVLIRRCSASQKDNDATSLERQYLHKAVVLVIERTPDGVIGLVLNRPTYLFLQDRVFGARILYGGDQNSIHEANPKFYCLHSREDTEDESAKGCILRGLYMTSISRAQNLVRNGGAEPTDFVTLCGFVFWSCGQLEYELDRGLWHSTSVDVTTLYAVLKEELPWEYLLEKMGSVVPPETKQSTFGDRMLNEWSKQYLHFNEAPQFLQDSPEPQGSDEDCFQEGDILVPESLAHIFINQEHHKSLLLVLQNDDELTVTVLLNHPTSERAFGTVPVRFGGDLVMPPFVLHRLKNIEGEAVGDVSNGILKASVAKALEAIHAGAALPEDFVVVQGINVWEKDEYGVSFLGKEFEKGRWERASADCIDPIWESLLEQSPMARETLEKNLNVLLKAWKGAKGLDSTAAMNDDNPALTALGRDAVRVWATRSLLRD
jgi:putative AlgH/UPF0301 family transcriptional regulator